MAPTCLGTLSPDPGALLPYWEDEVAGLLSSAGGLLGGCGSRDRRAPWGWHTRMLEAGGICLPPRVPTTRETPLKFRACKGWTPGSGEPIRASLGGVPWGPGDFFLDLVSGLKYKEARR